MSVNIVDITGRPLVAGDFILYTLNGSGYIKFGVIEEIKTNVSRTGYQDNPRIKISHRTINGTQIYETTYDSVNKKMVDTDTPYATWAHYTGSERFMVTQPI